MGPIDLLELRQTFVVGGIGNAQLDGNNRVGLLVPDVTREG